MVDVGTYSHTLNVWEWESPDQKGRLSLDLHGFWMFLEILEIFDQLVFGFNS